MGTESDNRQSVSEAQEHGEYRKAKDYAPPLTQDTSSRPASVVSRRVSVSSNRRIKEVRVPYNHKAESLKAANIAANRRKGTRGPDTSGESIASP